MIFYSNPRDVSQEQAAIELASRDWRWHKVLHQWLQKDTRESQQGSSLTLIDSCPDLPVGAMPERLGERLERGVYVFFDANNWRRERRKFILDYDQLDHRPGVSMPGAAVGMPGQTGMPAAARQQGGAGSMQMPGARAV